MSFVSAKHFTSKIKYFFNASFLSRNYAFNDKNIYKICKTNNSLYLCCALSYFILVEEKNSIKTFNFLYLRLNEFLFITYAILKTLSILCNAWLLYLEKMKNKREKHLSYIKMSELFNHGDEH